MTKERDRQKLAKLLELDMKIRGIYLSHVVPIEDLVREIISYHFCVDESKRKQFLSLILYGKDYTFSFGIDVLEKIIANYPEANENFPNVVQELDKIRNFRNKLAHSMLDTSPEFLEKNLTNSIRLIKYGDRGETNYINVALSEVSERIQSCLDLTFDLTQLKVWIRNAKNQP